MDSSVPATSPSSSPISHTSLTAPISPLSSNDDLHIFTTRGSNNEPTGERRTILHLGDPIKYNKGLSDQLSKYYNIIRPSPDDLERSTFIKHLKQETWGQFCAIMRPFWATGKEMHPWNRELIELLPKSMKVMTSAGAGFDWVDVPALTERGIVYCNGAHASTEAVADMALYFIIAVFRNMKWSSEAAQSNDADQFEIAHREVPAASRNPCGHTLGIVGLGNIGFAIAQKVKPALAMNIIYYDVIRKDKNKENSIGAEFCPSLSELLQRSDCVLIATPHSETPILNDTTLGLLPRGARVVNIARGSVVDESALARALDTGHISAAAMDVHQDEPRVNRRLSRRQNVIMTCHTGGGTMETNIGFERLAIENVDLVLKGRAPKTPVNSVEVGARPILGPKEKHKMLDDVESIAAKRQHVDS